MQVELNWTNIKEKGQPKEEGIYKVWAVSHDTKIETWGFYSPANGWIWCDDKTTFEEWHWTAVAWCAIPKLGEPCFKDVKESLTCEEVELYIKERTLFPVVKTIMNRLNLNLHEAKEFLFNYLKEYPNLKEKRNSNKE